MMLWQDRDCLENLLPYVKADKNFAKYMTPYNMKRLRKFSISY